ncbi:MAG TPA: AI-2E family transporter [Thermoanaerobaculia bacterium]|nr:AI-2E family transporter [Thermoanaerobaculia bacterium]
MTSPRALKLEKWLVWAGLIGVIWLLRSLFPALFLTFILTWIGNTIVNWLGRWITTRRLALVLWYVVLILALTGLMFLIVPRMFSEARDLARLYIAQDAVSGEIIAAETEPAQRTLPPPTTPSSPEAGESDRTALDRETRKYVDTIIIQLVGLESFRSFRQSDMYPVVVERAEQWVRNFIPRVIEGVREFVNGILAVAFQFFLSIIFSFLILWDLHHLRSAATSLATGRTAEIYIEIAPGLTAFARMLGRAFEAQSIIALFNAFLTSIGFIVLGIPSIALLATIVFFCSYIPVFGVILSTLPAALLAFQKGGAMLVLWLVLMVLIVHAVEAYALNPLIYGRHLRMHPVAVLIILLVGEHLFGVWGLLLGVPISAFFYKYLVKGESID